MTVNSGMFNSVAGDRKYDASWFADYFASFIGNGVFPNPSNGLQVMEYQNMQTAVKVGKGWINGYYVTNTDDYIIQHDVADSSLSRIDRIVLQKSTADRAIKIVVKKGNLSSSPSSPSIVRNADYHELVLADVRISAGVTRIIQSNITDQRLNNSLCGIVHGTVNQVDTTTIFNQYQSWFNNYSSNREQEFSDWQVAFNNWEDQTKQAVDDWINNEQLDFETWRMEQENLFGNWYNQQRSFFTTWFNDIKQELETVDVAEHISSEMPHRFVDIENGKTFKWGLGAQNGVPYILIEEVV